MKENNLTKTQKIVNLDKPQNKEIQEILQTVYEALTEKGYNPVNQIVGYFLSGDPTYITGSRNARTLITKFERDELLEEIVNFYLKNNLE